MLDPFHLAIRVRDIDEAREFYGQQLGCPEGRSSVCWIDFNLYGHQLVTHLDPSLGKRGSVNAVRNDVDKHAVPVPHFGVVLAFPAWESLVERAKTFVDDFVVPPHIRFKGEVGEQGTVFFLDPSGNALEFKAFRDRDSQLFAKR